MRFLIFVTVSAFMSLVPGCGDPDCRQKAAECAEGFACAQVDGGAWGCVPGKAPKVVEPERPGEKLTRCDGVPACSEKSAECYCDAAKKLRIRRVDKNGDGTADEQTEFKYNPMGLNHLVLTDVGIDGVVDVTSTFQHDDAGRPTISETIHNPDGLIVGPNVRVVLTYDEHGAIVSEETNVGIDDTIDRRCEFDPPCKPPLPNPSCKPRCERPTGPPSPH
jgi:hypothetical protein